MKTSAILLSRQPLRPCGRTPWVRQTLSAVEWVKDNHRCLFTSLGMQTWELLIHLAQRRNIEQVVLIPATHEDHFEKMKEYAVDQFVLDLTLVRFRAIMPKFGEHQYRKLLYDRDCAAVLEADTLIPVSIRAEGHMEYLMRKKISQKQGALISQFQVEYQKRAHPIAYTVERDQLPSETIAVGDRYIIHWTRASNGPWPTENKQTYFSSVAGSDCYPRNAFHTLQNIIKTGKIIASSAHMPGGIPTVSFSGLAPDNILSLMKWRARYRRMSFEPYGIGIEKKEALQTGVVPVRYYRKGNCPVDIPVWQLQSRGVKTDWKKEAEYRYPGDFSLSDTAKMACFCHTRDEADFIEKRFGIKSYSFIR